MNSGTIDVSGMQTMMTVIGYGFGFIGGDLGVEPSQHGWLGSAG